MKVTKTYLKQLIEEELKNIHELEKEGEVPPVEDPAAAPEMAMAAEDDMSAEEMLTKIHDDLMSWMKKSGLNPSMGMDKPPIDVAE